MTSRQPKKIKLSDLSKELPTEEELGNYISILMNESDRGAAIMAGALVENAVWVALCSRLADPGEEITKSWFEGPTAPFGTFAAKIKLGRALGIYGEHMEKRLNIIKDIRNAFAHSARPLDFTNATLVSACIKLTPNPDRDAGKPMRTIFGASCVSLSRVLITDAFKNGGKEIEVSFP